MQIHSVGIDLGKTTFHLVALGAAGKVIVRKKFNRKQLLTYTANVPASLIGLEACSGAHLCSARIIYELKRQAFRSELPDGCQPPKPSVNNRIDEPPQVGLVGTWGSSRIGGRRSELRSLESLFSNCLDCRESVPSQAIGLLPRTPNPTTPPNERGSALVGFLVALLYLEIRSSGCQARYPDRLASQGVPAILEMEVATGQAADPAGPTATHCADGSR